MRNNNDVGNDLKAVAQDVMQLGARCVKAGRAWLTDRRNEMTDRDDDYRSGTPSGSTDWQGKAQRQDRQRGPRSYQKGSQEYGGSPGRQQGEGYGTSSGYGNPDSDRYSAAGYSGPAFVSPADTQQSHSGMGRQSYSGRGPRNYTRSDERITEDLCERLTEDHDIDASDIEVKVSQGTATLEGTVSQRWMKHRAEDVADSCTGVHSVENRIKVQSSGPVYGTSGSADVDSTASGSVRASQTGAPKKPASGSSSGTPH